MKKSIKASIYSSIFIYGSVILAFSGLIVMKLLANKAHKLEETELARVKAKALPVRAETITFSNNTTELEASGTIENSTDLMLMAKAQGQIMKVLKEKGDWVKVGDPIVVLERDVLLSQQELAKANYESAKRDYERIKRLVEKNAATKKQLEDMSIKLSKTSADYKSISKNVENTIVKSPVSGFITDNYVEKGAMVSGGVKICNIISPDKLLVNIFLTGEEVAMLSMNKEVSVHVKAFSNDIFKGIVSNIALKAASNNKFKVEVQLQTNEKLKAGMYANVFINKSGQETIKIPRLAISGTLKEASVFIVKDGKVHEKSVVVGESYGDSVSIISGLQEGEVVVTSGAINLWNTATVKVLNQK